MCFDKPDCLVGTDPGPFAARDERLLPIACLSESWARTGLAVYFGWVGRGAESTRP
jgi:hypothetical protein